MSCLQYATRRRFAPVNKPSRDALAVVHELKSEIPARLGRLIRGPTNLQIGSDHAMRRAKRTQRAFQAVNSTMRAYCLMPVPPIDAKFRHSTRIQPSGIQYRVRPNSRTYMPLSKQRVELRVAELWG